MAKSFIADRKEAGLLLAEKLLEYKNKNALVLAIPRGGVPVGAEITKHLNLALDLVMAKKIPHPMNAEFAIGSVAADVVLLDPVKDIPRYYIESTTEKLKQEIGERYTSLTGKTKLPSVKNKTIILVDDGIATGNTLLAAASMLKKKGAQKIVVAIPVLPFDRIKKIKSKVDELIYLQAPGYFPGVGAFYRNFEQVSDEDVKRLLKENNKFVESESNELEWMNDYFLL
jgi:putative phosphoribosyl transferase